MRKIRITNEYEVGDTCGECERMAIRYMNLDGDMGPFCVIFNEKEKRAYPRCQQAEVKECDHPDSWKVGGYSTCGGGVSATAVPSDYCPDCGERLGEGE